MSDVERDLINLYDFLVCMTNAVDLVSPEVADHHQRVAYLAFRIAEGMGLPLSQKKDLVLAGLLHDAGALSLDERLELIESEPLTSENHAFRGAWLFECFPPLQRTAEIIRYHHVPWDFGEGRIFNGNTVPDLSHILHLADRIAVQADPGHNILDRVGLIKERIVEQKGSVFVPELVDAFLEISVYESLWLDILYEPLLFILPDLLPFDKIALDLDGFIDLTKVFSRIIDFRSPFTATHSAGVAKTAEKLAELAGFSESECKEMLIAGNLHDLGKLAVCRKVLDKPGKLDPVEISEVRSHSFYTYRLLQPIKGFETINKWASFHHEKLNGQGYPFHLDGSSIPLGSRIMAVADIFTAITEDRPYREGMSDQQAASILGRMAKDNCICPYVVSLLMENFREINEIRREAEEKAVGEYNYYLQDPSFSTEIKCQG